MNSLFDFDKNILSDYDYIIGTDEAGRGPVAGDVYGAAVCFCNPDTSLFDDLNDSKKISEKKREFLYKIIKENSIYSINSVSISKIEEINILNSALLAMQMSVLDVLSKLPNGKKVLVLVDGNRKIKFNLPQITVVKGDSKSASIAASSILAKVERDRYMLELYQKYPQYNWIKNKGYLTKEHLELIKIHGICPYHRKSFLKKVL